MEITIEHTTNYEYLKPISGLIQTTKLYPTEHNGLKIIKLECRSLCFRKI